MMGFLAEKLCVNCEHFELNKYDDKLEEKLIKRLCIGCENYIPFCEDGVTMYCKINECIEYKTRIEEILRITKADGEKGYCECLKKETGINLGRYCNSFKEIDLPY